MSFRSVTTRGVAASFATSLLLPAAALAATADRHAAKHPHAPPLVDHGENTPLHLTQPVTHTAGAAVGSGGGGSIVRTIVGLAVVIGVIYGVAWVMRQMKSSKEEKLRGSGLASVASIPLGSNRSVHLIQAGSEFVLVGVAEHSVTPLRTYRGDEARAAGLLDEDDDVIDADVSTGGTGAGSSLPVVRATAKGKPAASGARVPWGQAFVGELRKRTVRR